MADRILGRIECYPLFQLEPAFQYPRLLARPGADLALPRAAGEVGVGLGGVDRRDLALDADLASQAFPVEQQRRLGGRQQLPALAALIVGVEHEALGVIALQQHHPAGRHAVLAHGGQGHGGGIVRFRGLRLGKPRGEHVKRIGGPFRSDLHATPPRSRPPPVQPIGGRLR
jgi:hypothetical protein